MCTFIRVALFSVNTGGWPSLSPGQLMPTVLPPQSTVVLVKVAPATHALLPLVEELELEELLLDEEDELLLELELEDEELEELPLQAAASAKLPEEFTARESIFTRPALLVASNRMLWMPPFSVLDTTAELAQVVKEPVAGISMLATASTPSTIKRAGRLPDAFA
jgi:hypothetical protein